MYVVIKKLMTRPKVWFGGQINQVSASQILDTSKYIQKAMKDCCDKLYLNDKLIRSNKIKGQGKECTVKCKLV